MIRNRPFRKHHPALFLYTLLGVFLLIGSACRFFAPSTPTEASPTQDTPITDFSSPQPEPTSTMILPSPTTAIKNQHRQWAVSAADQRTSEEASYAIGEPDSQGCELTPRESVWVYQSDSPPQNTNYLQVFFAEPVLPKALNIYLAYTHSAIVRVSLIDLAGQPHTIYEGLPQDLPECPYELSIDAMSVSAPVYAARIDVETTDPEIFGLTAIDAVELVGDPLAESQPTPNPTPYLTMSSLGINAADVQEGFVFFEVINNHSGETLSTTECNAFSFNLTETERTIRFFSCKDQTEVWLYAPLSLDIGSMPLNSYPLVPTARLFIEGRYIPAMEGELWVDFASDSHMTGVLEFKGFDPENQVDYYRVVAVFNQIPLNDEAAQKPGDMIPQWSSQATASSERSTGGNAAAQAAGPSDTWENCEEASTTWKPAETDAAPWIELSFQTGVQPVVLNILFSGSPDAVSAVNLLSETDFFPLDLETARVLDECPQVLTFNFTPDAPENIIGLQVLLDPEHLNTQFGIDAVQMIGVISD